MYNALKNSSHTFNELITKINMSWIRYYRSFRRCQITLRIVFNTAKVGGQRFTQHPVHLMKLGEVSMKLVGIS